MTITKAKWEQAGIVSVDSGMLMVGDPSYIDTQWTRDGTGERPGEYSYEGCLKCGEATGQLMHKIGRPGAGVVVSSGGDGKYPVMVRRDPVTGRILEMRVSFDSAPDRIHAGENYEQ